MSEPLAGLIEALRCLPGVGQRSAQRMAYHLLQHDRPGALRLADALRRSVDGVAHCPTCHTFTHGDACDICSDAQRDRSQLCVVETPADQAALERTRSYRGLYFVLLGRLSPLDGADAAAASLPAFQARLADPGVREVIVATSFTAEGEATAFAVSEIVRSAAVAGRAIRASRLARGVPAGSELEFVDLSTIAHALAERR